MAPNTLDWLIVAAYFVVSLVIGLLAMQRAGKNTSEFFLSGRNMPWWLLGVSMVATTFSADTPNLVTDMVRSHGVAGNWKWWAFLLTGMLTVFVYAKLWRRSMVQTDIEFYELRYSGRSAAVLRGFRALYLGVFFNVLIMASVTLAAVKIGGAMLNLTATETILIACTVTVIYSMLGGLMGVLLTDFFQFFLAMAGAVAAAIVAVRLPEVGGLGALLTHEAVRERLTLLPDFSDGRMALSVFIIPIAVQWWSVWYPGAEPGGGGYIAQRMLAAKNERHAVGATLLFNVAHYALRPWPWILVALASLVVFPDLASLRDAFPEMAESRIKNDLAYPAMLTFLPHGLLGVVLASLLAAYMSTIATHLNWGSSYVVNDFHKRFVRPEASERELVFVGRLATLILMILSAALALWLENALQAFDILLQVGAGTGLLFILRWFWWRINAFSELTAMIVSFLVAVVFQLFGPPQLVEWFPGIAQWAGYVSLPEELPTQFPDWFRLCSGVAITTCAWVAVTVITPPTSPQRLRAFYRLVRPGGPGWARVVDAAARDGEQLEPAGAGWNVPLGLLCAAVGCLAVYSALFATGYWIYGNTVPAVGLTVVAAVATVVLTRLWRGVVRGSEEA